MLFWFQARCCNLSYVENILFTPGERFWRKRAQLNRVSSRSESEDRILPAESSIPGGMQQRPGRLRLRCGLQALQKYPRHDPTSPRSRHVGSR